MGYYSRISGQLTIEPLMRWREYRNSQYRNPGYDKLVKLIEDVETVDTEDGTAEKRQAVAVAPNSDDSVKAYDLEEQVQELVNEFPGHTLTGALRIEGEEALDVWKLTVVNGKVTEIRPTITWPDGTTEPAGRD